MNFLIDTPGVEVPIIPDNIDHAFYRLYVTVAPVALGETGTTAPIIDRMNRAKLPVGSGSCADMSLESAFTGKTVRRAGDLCAATDMGRRSVAFPVDHLLDETDMRRFADGLKAAL
jgi:dTDP-4-amino-4,6-dideoxygalactose transaminase